MGLFDGPYQDLAAFLERRRNAGRVSEFLHSGTTDWPSERRRNLVLATDTAVELGGPGNASTAFLIWVTDAALLKNGRISIVGPDLPQLTGRQVCFGRVILVAGADFDADNSYDRYREMEMLRYDLHLKGYMMRGASQYQREWSRVSREAVAGGFSLRHIGGALMDQLSALDYVQAAETLFITASPEDVAELQAVAADVGARISAMNKMAESLSFDCATCAYRPVCADVAELRAMRRKQESREPSRRLHS